MIGMDMMKKSLNRLRAGSLVRAGAAGRCKTNLSKINGAVDVDVADTTKLVLMTNYELIELKIQFIAEKRLDKHRNYMIIWVAIFFLIY